MKKLSLLIVFGLFFIGCDLVYINESMNETNAKEENFGGGITKTLVEDEWTDGNFSKDGQIDTYYISVIKGTRYFIFKYNGSSDIGLKISHSDGTIICNNYDATDLSEKPYEFIATSSGTVTVTVASWSFGNWERGTGYYTIKYSSRQEGDVLLSEGVWKDDRIIANGQTNKHHINVTAGTRYFIWLNGKDYYSVDKYYGDGTKTADVGLKISYSDGTVICNDYTRGRLYKEPYTFTAPNTGTVIVTVASYGYVSGSVYDCWEIGSGTYAIKYTSRSEYDVLSEGEWKDDDIIADGQTNVYSINVIAGKLYSIYMNNECDGDGTKTAETGLKISHSDGTVIRNDYVEHPYSAAALYSIPWTFTASSTGTVTITVSSIGLYSEGYGYGYGTGTYAIKYTSYEDGVLPEWYWKDDKITVDGQTNKYSIYVTEGKQYCIHMSNAYNGGGTAYAGLKISHSDGTIIYNSYSDAKEAYKFTASSTGIVTITVASRNSYYGAWERGTGTYSIFYYTMNN